MVVEDRFVMKQIAEYDEGKITLDQLLEAVAAGCIQYRTLTIQINSLRNHYRARLDEIDMTIYHRLRDVLELPSERDTDGAPSGDDSSCGRP